MTSRVAGLKESAISVGLLWKSTQRLLQALLMDDLLPFKVLKMSLSIGEKATDCDLLPPQENSLPSSVWLLDKCKTNRKKCFHWKNYCGFFFLLLCCKLNYCIPVQGSLLADTSGWERGAELNASAGRLAQDHLSSKEPFYEQTPQPNPQCPSLLRTKGFLKPTLFSHVHPSDPSALYTLWVFYVI